MNVCVEQLTAFKENISDWSKVVIAYEPVWAIGELARTRNLSEIPEFEFELIPPSLCSCYLKISKSPCHFWN